MGRGRNRRLLWLMGDPCRGGRPVQGGALRRGVGPQPGGLRVLSARPEKEPWSKRRENLCGIEGQRRNGRDSCVQEFPREGRRGGEPYSSSHCTFQIPVSAPIYAPFLQSSHCYGMNLAISNSD